MKKLIPILIILFMFGGVALAREDCDSTKYDNCPPDGWWLPIYAFGLIRVEVKCVEDGSPRVDEQVVVQRESTGYTQIKTTDEEGVARFIVFYGKFKVSVSDQEQNVGVPGIFRKGLLDFNINCFPVTTTTEPPVTTTIQPTTTVPVTTTVKPTTTSTAIIVTTSSTTSVHHHGGGGGTTIPTTIPVSTTSTTIELTPTTTTSEDTEPTTSTTAAETTTTVPETTTTTAGECTTTTTVETCEDICKEKCECQDETPIIMIFNGHKSCYDRCIKDCQEPD